MNKAKAIAKITEILKNVKRRRTQRNYTHMENLQFAVTKPVITGRTVTFHTDFSRFVVPEKLPRGFISMDGRQTINSLPIVRVTKTHGLLGSGTVNHWYIKTTYGFAVVHRSGSVQISSPNAVGRVAEQLERVGVYVQLARITKFDATMKVNRLFNFDGIGRHFPTSLGSFSYEPEIINRANVKWNDPSMTLVLYGDGKVQIFGAARPDDAVNVMRRIIEKVTPQRAFKLSRTNAFGRLVPTEQAGLADAIPHFETRNERLAKNALKKLNTRHPRVSGYNYVPNAGKYVRPGPNGKPRLYNIKKNMGLVTAKITKAYANAGVNMPEYVAQLVLANPPFMMGAPGAKRAKNWNDTLNGHYIRPGPGKQPHFYKIPKDLKAGFKTAKKAYNDAGMNVPQRVKNIFGVTGSPKSGSPVRANHVVNGNKVNGRQYSRLTTAQLVAIARNLGNAGASNSMTKAAIFERIKSRARVKTPSPTRSPNVTVNGRVYIFSNDPLNQRIVRDGRKRVFSTLPKNEREAIARAYLGNAYTGIQPKNWYNTMRAKKKYG